MRDFVSSSSSPPPLPSPPLFGQRWIDGLFFFVWFFKSSYTHTHILWRYLDKNIADNLLCNLYDDDDRLFLADSLFWSFNIIIFINSAGGFNSSFNSMFLDDDDDDENIYIAAQMTPSNIFTTHIYQVMIIIIHTHTRTHNWTTMMTTTNTTFSLLTWSFLMALEEFTAIVQFISWKMKRKKNLNNVPWLL